MHTTPNMTEQELLNDLLEQEKTLVKSYATFITESSCPNMRQVLIDQFNSTCQNQYRVFDQMKQKGYYQTKDAQDMDVQQAKQQMTQLKSQLVS
ncbi:MAG: spore coat protein [Bacillota bacterium]|nr:spore coat protein [Bacillota bacterium]